MRIVAISFFRDFARYFSYLEDYISSEYSNRVSFFHVSLYPCAHDYFLRRGKRSLLLPYTLRGTENIADRRNLVAYEESLFRNQQQFRRILTRANYYQSYFETLFREQHYDLLLSSGDSRMPIRAAIESAKKNSIPVAYFEQGPFGTTIIDAKGVNANVSFSGKFLPHESDKENLNELKYLEQWKKSPKSKYYHTESKEFVERLSTLKTLITLRPPKLLSKFLPPELMLPSDVPRSDSISSWIFGSKEKFEIKKQDFVGMHERYLLLLLQIPQDAQMLLHSHIYTGIYDIVSDVLQARPDGYNIIIREHPLYKGKYDERIYKTVARNSAICIIDNSTEYSKLIKESTVVIVNNSTAGLDALSYSKTLITLGESYYNNPRLVYHLEDRKLLEALIKKAIAEPISRQVINEYLQYLLSTCLIKGHYTDSELNNAEEVYRKLREIADVQ